MEPDERTQAKREQLLLLHETSAGTPMGTLLRSFWQPVADASKLAKGEARAVRVMGEDLTLYRGESGQPHLVGGRCAHRCTVLHTGWVQEEQIRCMYHGWRYDPTGQCTEQPAEKRGARPELIKIAGYPCHEYGGLIFAYMGAGPAPEFNLPRKGFLDDTTRHAFIFDEVWDCNWFQQVENSLDSAHLGYAHIWGRMSRFGEEISTGVPELSYEETSAGMLQIATRSPTNVRISDWTFPNNNHVIVPGPKRGDAWSHISVWTVPIDDTRTQRLTIISSQAGDRRLQDQHDFSYQPLAHAEELFGQHRMRQDLGATQVLSTQDYVAVCGQGAIVNRLNEHLGQTDMGIAILRRLFFRELEAMRLGQQTKRWSMLEKQIELPIQIPETAAG